MHTRSALLRDTAVNTVLRVIALQLVVGSASGQGLELAPSAVAASGAAAAPLVDQYRQQVGGAKAWKAAFKAGPRAACGPQSSSSVCSAGGSNEGRDAASILSIATSPLRFSSLEPRPAGGARVLGPARDQRPCAACAAFAVVTAAEAAVARATNRDAVDAVGSLSMQDLAFCTPPGERGCNSSWSLASALQALESRPLLLERCLPFDGQRASRPSATGAAAAAALCTEPRRCDDISAVASLGTFSHRPLEGAAEVQSHIREWGAVVTRFDVASDFVAFFEAKGNAKKVYSPKKGARVVMHHAVTLVGYSNEGDTPYWIARQSWGTSFADGGNFKVAFDAAGVLSPGDTYGIMWTPTVEQAGAPLPTTPSKTPGCVLYTAKEGDYLSFVAQRAGIPVAALLLDNAGAIADLDAPLTGKTLALCNRSPGGPTAAGAAAGGPAGQGPLEWQLRALLDLKQAVKAELQDWTAATGRGGGYCRGQWLFQVECDDTASNVTGVAILSTDCDSYKCAGALLPAAAVLARLPRLRKLRLGRLKLQGTLPEGYGWLSGLQELAITDNPQLQGTLPAAWAGMTGLRSLTIRSTSIGGTLPALLGTAWARSLRELDLRDNRFVGSVPREWGALAASLESLKLSGNAGLHGCLPEALRALLGGGGEATAGTRLSKEACAG